MCDPGDNGSIVFVFRKEVNLMDTVVQLIANLGFPISCVIALFYYINKTTETYAKVSMENGKEYMFVKSHDDFAFLAFNRSPGSGG